VHCAGTIYISLKRLFPPVAARHFDLFLFENEETERDFLHFTWVWSDSF
jgi:hypothetical protein